MYHVDTLATILVKILAMFIRQTDVTIGIAWPLAEPVLAETVLPISGTI